MKGAFNDEKGVISLREGTIKLKREQLPEEGTINL
jgi:hypothetical protein